MDPEAWVVRGGPGKYTELIEVRGAGRRFVLGQDIRLAGCEPISEARITAFRDPRSTDDGSCIEVDGRQWITPECIEL